SRRVDVRVIAATHRDLSEEVRAGRFREDLFYRLNVFRIPLPPLRERREDIPLLAQHFLEEASRRAGKRPTGIHPDALHCMTVHPFPGNIRELENEIERAVTLAEDGAPITADLLSESLRRAGRKTPKGGPSPGADAPLRGTLREAVEELERRMLAQALGTHNGNRTQAAAALGLSRLGLLKKIRRYGLED
ncbi:MAG: sigma 54-interacting transcriptional regulator, partial [Nitrospinota bacterium]